MSTLFKIEQLCGEVRKCMAGPVWMGKDRVRGGRPVRGRRPPALPRPTEGSIDPSRPSSTHSTNHNPTHPHTQLTSSNPDSRLRTVGAIDWLLFESQELAALPNDTIPAYVMATAGRLHHFTTEGGSRPLNMEAVEASGCVVDRSGWGG